jgi:hypothetical protein
MTKPCCDKPPECVTTEWSKDEIEGLIRIVSLLDPDEIRDGKAWTDAGRALIYKARSAVPR